MTQYDPVTDYLMHYGRKGMKWHKHIFGDDKKSDYIHPHFVTSERNPRAEKLDSAGSRLVSRGVASFNGPAFASVYGRPTVAGARTAANLIGSNRKFQISRRIRETAVSAIKTGTRARNHVAYLANRRIDQITHRKTGAAVRDSVRGSGFKTSTGRKEFGRNAGRFSAAFPYTYVKR